MEIEKPLSDGSVVAYGFSDDDVTKTDLRMKCLDIAMRDTLWYQQKHNHDAHWRSGPRITRENGRVVILARLVST